MREPRRRPSPVRRCRKEVDLVDAVIKWQKPKGFTAGKVDTLSNGVDVKRMNQRQYAAHRGVTPQRISHLVGEGRIELDENGLIDVAKADLVLDGITKTSVSRHQNRSVGGSLTEARVRTEEFRAHLLELDYRKRVGQVLDAEEAQVAIERLGELLVRDLEQLPTYSDQILDAALTDGLSGVKKKMKELVREIRVTITNNLTLNVVDDEPDIIG